MINYLSPENYIEDFEMGSKFFKSVDKGTAGFLGLAEKGEVKGNPIKVSSVIDFFRKFGGYISNEEFGEYRYLAYSVEQFFENGGKYCYVMRVVPADANVAVSNPSKRSAVKIKAKNPGVWGNKINIKVSSYKISNTEIVEKLSSKQLKVKSTKGLTVGDIVVVTDGINEKYNKIVSVKNCILEFKKTIRGSLYNKGNSIKSCGISCIVKYEDSIEIFENMSLNKNSENYVKNVLENSNLIDVEIDSSKVEKIKDPFLFFETDKKKKSINIKLKNGKNGSIKKLSAKDFIGDENEKRGIISYKNFDDVNTLSIPGVTDLDIINNLVYHCEDSKDKIAVIDMPKDSKSTLEIQNFRNKFDSEYVTSYYPWIKIFDPQNKKNIAIPPSGSVLGIYSKTDNHRGIHKAPVNEKVKNCVGLDALYTKSEYQLLESRGINTIRSFSGQGIRVWGYKTFSREDEFKYINEIRLLIYMKKSIKEILNWAKEYEINDELINRMKKNIYFYLTSIWRNGILIGNTPEETFKIELVKDYDDISFDVHVSIKGNGKLSTFTIDKSTL
jgi:hypothetical protein